MTDAATLDDPRALIDRTPMSAFQIAAIALCVMLNALDGFDVLSIGFASPGISTEWGIGRAALGVVLSMELIGMVAGSLLLGGVADRVGRRPTILACLAIMASGMVLTASSQTIWFLSACRLLTGVGIGGMLACTNAMVAELANARRRDLCVSLMAAGYPLGAVVGGTVASFLLTRGGWRGVFLFGGLWTLALVPPTVWLLPESVAWLTHRRPSRALERINAVLARMRHARIDRLPPVDAPTGEGAAVGLFSPALAATTVQLTAAYFLHIATFYFILKWTPKIVADMGFAPSSAGGVLVWASLGGMIGALMLSLLATVFDVRRLVIGAMAASVAMVAFYGMSGPDLQRLSVVAGIAGACTNGAVVGLYAIVARAFPAAVRAGGTGFVIGVGRGGAALGPVFAGALFAHGVGLPGVAAIMATGSLFAALALAFLPGSARGAYRVGTGVGSIDLMAGSGS